MQMNEKLLGQVLSSTKDSHHVADETKELAGAVIKTFGTNTERELLEDPVIVKETDKVCGPTMCVWVFRLSVHTP